MLIQSPAKRPTSTIMEQSSETAGIVNRLSRWFAAEPVLVRVVLLLVALAYARTLLFDFAYDDNSLIVLNPWVTSWKFTPVIFKKSFWQFTEWKRIMDYYRPMVTLLFLTIRQTLGAVPASFHLVVVGVHVAATYLTYVLVRRLTADGYLAVLSAGIFGLHPSRVESVAWISGVSDSLSLTFFLGSALLFLKWEESEEKRWHYLSAILLLLSILSKEVIVFAPLAFGVYVFSKTQARLRSRIGRTAGAMLPYAVVAIGASAARMYVLWNSPGPAEEYSKRVGYAILSAPEAFLWYLRQQVWPAKVSVYYPILLVKEFSWLHFVLPLIAALVILGTAVYLVRRSPAGQFLLTFSLLSLAPAVAFHIIIQVHDRYGYMAAVGESVALAWLVVTVLKRAPIALRFTTPVGLMIVLAALTSHQARYWEDNLTLFRHATEVGYDHFAAYEGMFDAYLEREMADEALEVTKCWTANARNPKDGWLKMASLYLLKDDPVRAKEALDHILPELKPARQQYQLGNIALAESKCDDAEKHYRKAVALESDVAEMHTKLSKTLRCLGRNKEAWEEMATAQRIRDANVY